MDQSAVNAILSAAYPHKKLEGCDAGDSELHLVSKNHAIESLERFQHAPNRIKAAVSLSSAQSFCDYINRFGNTESAIYTDIEKGTFTALIDHYAAGKPSWCDHMATFAPKRSFEWLAWLQHHEKWLTQTELAEAVEELLHTINNPEPNQVLQAALQFESNQNLVCSSSKNLDDGSAQFVFTKDNVSKTIIFPHRIKLALSVCDNETPIIMNARIRYKVSGDGVLAFKFSFVNNPTTIVRDQLLAMAAEIVTKTSLAEHYEGRPSK